MNAPAFNLGFILSNHEIFNIKSYKINNIKFLKSAPVQTILWMTELIMISLYISKKYLYMMV